MNSLVSLDGYAPDLQQYLLHHRYPAIMESLLTGLSVMGPPDPWEFLQSCLHQLIEGGPHAPITRLMFVAKCMHPPLLGMKRGLLEIFMDEVDLPTQEVLEQVFYLRKMSLQRLFFQAWKVLNLEEKRANRIFQRQLIYAKNYYSLKWQGKVFEKWMSYSAYKIKSRVAGYAKLHGAANKVMLKYVFYAWLDDHLEGKKVRRWFIREGGGQGQEEAEDEWRWPEGEDPVSTLPITVAIKVFSMVGLQGLCRCAQVCHSWKEITEEPLLWNKVDFSPVHHLVRDEVLHKMTHKYRPLLCQLNLRGCTQLSSKSLKTISLCQNLQDLNLSELKAVNEEVMEHIGRCCIGLFHLNLSFCIITDSIMLILTKHCDNLHYLSVAHCCQFTSKGLRAITSGRGCRRLVYLDLSGCKQLSAEGLGFIGRGCPILSTLLLDDIPDCSDDMLLQLVSHCKTLRHISFMGSSKLTDKSFVHLALESRSLSCIKIENDLNLTDVTMKVIGRRCRSLRHLFIAGCSRVTDNGLKELGKLKKLQILNIADCVRISDVGVRYVVESHYAPYLKELNLTNLSKISDVTLLRISQNCQALCCLSFCYCEHISDVGVELLGRIPSLASLDLTGCSIQDEGIKGLRNNPQFRHLVLAELTGITDDGLQQISDEGVEQLTFYCRTLQTLYLANCHKVTDVGTKCIARGCPYIARLDLSGCNITDRSLILLRKSSSYLQKLDILCCVSITREAVLKMRQSGVEVCYSTEQPKPLQQTQSQPLPALTANTSSTRQNLG